jgi:predicted kinase
MIPLFGDPQPAGKRDVLEGRLIWLALEVLRLGTNVVLDFGLWSRDEAVMCQRERMHLERAG